MNDVDTALAPAATVDLQEFYNKSNIGDVMDSLDRDPRRPGSCEDAHTRSLGPASGGKCKAQHGPAGRAAFPDTCASHGNPGTGKTTVAQRMAEILNRLGYIRRNHVVTVSRDDLVGQYIGHTAPKTKEVLKKAMGGVLFIDEAYYLYRPENERDYGQEAIEILLQVMEDRRDDLVVILAGYKGQDGHLLQEQPGHGLAHRPSYRLPRL